MKRILTLPAVLAGLALALTTPGRAAAPDGTSALRAGQVRTVYFSAVDATGGFVMDLTAADLAVKEGGKEREISGVQPATATMQVAILVDDGGSGAFQAPVAQFLQSTLGHAQAAVSLFNPQPQRVMNYSQDFEALKAAVGKLGQRGRIQGDSEQLIEAVGEAAKELQKAKAARPVILALTVSGEKALSDRADPALNDLKSSGAALSVVCLTGIELGKVLGDGPKQSGGLIEEVATGPALVPAAAKIADNLMHQFVLTYTLPDLVKPNEKLSLTTSRKGVTLIAPARVPDK